MTCQPRTDPSEFRLLAMIRCPNPETAVGLFGACRHRPVRRSLPAPGAARSRALSRRAIRRAVRSWAQHDHRATGRRAPASATSPSGGRPEGARAVRATSRGPLQGVGFRDATQRRARRLSVLGWVRNADDGGLSVHAEGASTAIEQLIAFLHAGPRGAARRGVSVEDVVGRGPRAVCDSRRARRRVRRPGARSNGAPLRPAPRGRRRDALLGAPQGASLDPSVKRLAVEVPDHAIEHNSFEGPTEHGGVVVWDRGDYEQGGRVAWPEALRRGHAVFVLHGHKLRGGFALQRTRPARSPSGC